MGLLTGLPDTSGKCGLGPWAAAGVRSAGGPSAEGGGTGGSVGSAECTWGEHHSIYGIVCLLFRKRVPQDSARKQTLAKPSIASSRTGTLRTPSGGTCSPRGPPEFDQSALSRDPAEALPPEGGAGPADSSRRCSRHCPPRESPERLRDRIQNIHRGTLKSRFPCRLLCCAELPQIPACKQTTTETDVCKFPHGCFESSPGFPQGSLRGLSEAPLRRPGLPGKCGLAPGCRTRGCCRGP